MLILAGGALYTFGGVVYGFKRPNPWPRWFGFHEVFHSFTVLAFAAHYVGVSMATYCLQVARPADRGGRAARLEVCDAGPIQQRGGSRQAQRLLNHRRLTASGWWSPGRAAS